MANQIRAFGLRQINPTGKSFLIFRNRVKPRNQKYFPSRLTQISCISLTVSSHQRGDRASSRARGGMRWTQGRKARRQSQGEMNLVSGQLACKMIGALADGEAVWFWHPLLVPSWRRRNQARPGLMSL